VDLTKLGFPSIAIVDDGAPADSTHERVNLPLKNDGDGAESERRGVGRMFLAGSELTTTGELVVIVESAPRAA
jgi:hypothetical protein